MEHEQVSCDSICDRLPPRLSSKYPWFLVQNLEDEENIGNQFLSTLHNPLLKYECKIPEFQGRRIAGCFHGWLILSNGDRLWSLCNPLTSEVKHLPRLTLKNGTDKSIGQCCLTAPPDDPTSVLLLIRHDKPAFVFCRLDRKRKRMRWIEMSYAYQLKRLTSDGELVNNITLCDGNIYVLSNDNTVASVVLQVEVLVKGRDVTIKLMMFGVFPTFYCSGCYNTVFLKGYGTDLFYIEVSTHEKTMKVCSVNIYKLDMMRVKREEIDRLKNWDLTGVNFDDFQLYLNSLVDSDTKGFFSDLDIIGDLWEEMDDLKDGMFYVDLDCYDSIFYNPSIGSRLGGYIHIRDSEILYLYHVKDRTIVSYTLPSTIESTTHIFMWEGRLLDDDGDSKCVVNCKQEEDEMVVKSIAVYDEVELNIPFDILKMIMERCVGVDYMNFRATCKQCRLAAPVIKWSEETSNTKLHNYSLNSPWLMVVDKNRRILSFKDPITGDEYFMKNSEVSIEKNMYYCSRFGWLLIYNHEFGGLVFFNPFTNELRRLPKIQGLESLCFSAPPTSPDCLLVGFNINNTGGWEVCFHLVNREAEWREVKLGGDPLSIRVLNLCGYPRSIRSSTFYGQDLYVLCTNGELSVFRGLFEGKCSREIFKAKAPRCCIDSEEEYHLMKCDENHLLLVIVSQFGESVELFKWTRFKDEWEEIDGVGKHTIYICGTTSLCVEAKTTKMENKIYFPQLDMKTDKILCYPLETAIENHMYYTHNRDIIQATFENFHESKHPLNTHVWIEPSWR